MSLADTSVQSVKEVIETKGFKVVTPCSLFLGIQLETSKLMVLVCICGRTSVALTSVLSRNVLYIVIAIRSQALCFLKQATETRQHIWKLWKTREPDEVQQGMQGTK